MSAPRTPTEPRTTSPLSPAPARPTTPARTGAAGRAKVGAGGGGGATASPQVKAALAALRKQRQASSSSTLNDHSSTDPPQDPFTTPIKPSAEQQRTSSPAAGPGGSGGGRASPFKVRREEEVVLEWAVKGEDKLIEEAKKTGLLNFASRELTAVPPSIYSSLLPRTSSYHPSNRQPRSSFRRDPQPDLRISSLADDAEGERAATWYEQQELRSLNLSSNEIGKLEEEIGGFEDLELLDLHNNSLSTLPTSLAWLTHLTSLNLSHNRLTTFPLPLLNLRLLRDLNLAGNQITHLWPSNSWKDALADILTPPGASPSATPESPERGGESFWDSFPSSPFHRNNNKLDGLPHPSQSRAPFPLLTTLSLAENPLARDALIPKGGFEFPPRLTNLDFSECGLVDSACPPEVFGRLKHLVELDLSKNDLADDLFAADLFPSSSSSTSSTTSPPLLFPSLRTLDLSLNPIDSLASLETYLTSRVQRPLSYIGLPKPIQNLISAEERSPARRGRRIGVPEGVEKGREGAEVRVKVTECLLREEQVRRRRAFPESEGSRARDKEREAEREREGSSSSSASVAGPAVAAPSTPSRQPTPHTRSPSPPPSPTPATTAAPPPLTSTSTSTSTPTKRQVILEDWEIEAAKGLSTPAGRRRAAALAAKEREERRAREEEEKEMRRREQEQEREKREQEKLEREREEVERRLADVKLEERDEEERSTSDRSASASPPPYSPRAPSPPPSSASLATSPPIPSRPAPTSAPAPASSSIAEASASDPAVQLISSALSPASSSSSVRSTLTLTSQSLSSFPVPTTGTPPVSLAQQQPTSIDLSRNSLPAIPLRGLEVWGWGQGLRSLCLSRNRIAALEVLETAAAAGEAFFPQLETLDLSHNFLPSTVSSPFPSSSAQAGEAETVSLFAALARLAPSLVTLNLHHNRLTSLCGISSLLLPPPASSDATNQSGGGGRGGGLKHLNLSENKIVDVEGLVEAAKEYSAMRGAEEKRRWRLEELDLSSNDVSKLPPHLGLLPPSLLLHLTGNTFRIPRREVYENAAEKRVIPYLREWLEGLS